MPRAQINGVDLHYQSYGRGLPVLLIHGGYGGPKTTVAPSSEPPLVEVLGRSGVRLITYDRRCTGRSEYLLDEITLEDIAADAAGVLDHLNIEKAVVIGSSAGGPIALQFALSWPARIVGLALPNTGPALMCEPPEGYREPYPEAVKRRLVRVRSFLEQVEGARRMGDRAYFETQKETLRSLKVPPGSARPPQEEADRLIEALEAIDDETLFTCYIGMLRNYAAYIDRDFTSRLRELSMPVFIVHGTADLAVPPEYGEALRDGIPHAEYHTISGAGHGILDYPEAQERLRLWIEGLAAG